MDLLTKVRKNENIAYRVIEEEALIVNPKDGLIYPLNSTSSRIWQLLDGQKSCGEVIAIIDSEFEGDKTAMQEDILNFIDGLLNNNLAALC